MRNTRCFLICYLMQLLSVARVGYNFVVHPGHKSYEPGTETHQKVVDAFGEDIVDEKGCIDRKKLGSIVFGKKVKTL